MKWGLPLLFAASLLAGDPDINIPAPDGTTALHRASYQGDWKRVDLLLREGANVNAATDLGVTPLWLAAETGSTMIVRRLLEAGANPNLALMAGETPLMHGRPRGVLPRIRISSPIWWALLRCGWRRASPSPT